MVLDYEEIEKFLMGQGLSERDAAMVTMKEYRAMRDEYNNKNYQKWDMVRWLAFMNIQLSPDIKSHNKPKRPKDLFKLPTDAKEETVKVSVTEQDIDSLERIGFFK